MRAVRAAAQSLKIDPEMLKRPLNVGFSGGEKKRMEILQMALLAPRLGVLDETDSGLDIDALRIVADGVNALRDPERAFLVITHYQRLLEYIKPDVVHVMARGRIVKTGGPELALELERNGYRDYRGRGGLSDDHDHRAASPRPPPRRRSPSSSRRSAQRASPDARRGVRRFERRACRPGAIEAWHYTDLRAALANAAPLAPPPDAAAIDGGARAAGDAARASATVRLVAGRRRLRRGAFRPRRRAGVAARSVAPVARRPPATTPIVWR